MSPPPPLAPPRDLTIPEPGSHTARDILSRAIRRSLGELPQVGRGLSLSPGVRADLSSFQPWIRLALAQHPGAVASAVRRPTAGALIRCLRPGRLPAARAEAALSELLGLLYLELAAQEAMPRSARMQHPPRQLVSLLAQASVELPADTTELLFQNGRMKVGFGAHEPLSLPLDGWARGSVEALSAKGVRVTAPYHPLERGLVLALADNNPVAMDEAHPDKEGNAVSLGGRPIQSWRERLRAALDIIDRYMPELRREMELFLHQIVPVGYDEERHMSASFQESLGTIYMSLHPSVMTLTEALIHEFSHNKINALFELDAVLENAFSPLYTSPVRPDPRPLHGVLLAVHAFVPVARLYEQMIQSRDPLARPEAFEARYEQIRTINREGTKVLLDNARPTITGRGVLAELERWDEHFGRRAAAHS
ncbi:aKG-HExxH-type peptide beta-hydroxylase [Chondromyces crocatus]|uniref:HEXXH motif domain-containing protein n=1 Tax=Chondromyces crocatus TaxID=52 RepID=A0A0K1E729_CHOCO|nr:HEXXH motif-containing putative peptide modification protein [Chondromyces crocatus]AKT36502.1 uncharacterized protein CMC5_006180 [Chondromyces crocatus]